MEDAIPPRGQAPWFPCVSLMKRHTLAEDDRRIEALRDKVTERATEGEDESEGDGINWYEVERAEAMLDSKEDTI